MFAVDISADICMFLMFAVNSLRVRRCWQSASLIAKYVRNALNLMPKSIQIHPKSIPNQPKWCQGAFRKRSREQVGSTCFPPISFWCLFGATWAMWLGILCPAGRQGALKIKLFGIKSHKKLKKVCLNGVDKPLPKRIQEAPLCKTYMVGHWPCR